MEFENSTDDFYITDYDGEQCDIHYEMVYYQKELINIRESKASLERHFHHLKFNKENFLKTPKKFYDFIEYIEKSLECLDRRIELNEMAFFKINQKTNDEQVINVNEGCHESSEDSHDCAIINNNQDLMDYAHMLEQPLNLKNIVKKPKSSHKNSKTNKKNILEDTTDCALNTAQTKLGPDDLFNTQQLLQRLTSFLKRYNIDRRIFLQTFFNEHDNLRLLKQNIFANTAAWSKMQEKNRERFLRIHTFLDNKNEIKEFLQKLNINIDDVNNAEMNSQYEEDNDFIQDAYNLLAKYFRFNRFPSNEEFKYLSKCCGLDENLIRSRFTYLIGHTKPLKLFTKDEYHILYQIYLTNPAPNSAEITQIAMRLNKRNEDLNKWFASRRYFHNLFDKALELYKMSTSVTGKSTSYVVDDESDEEIDV